VGEVTEALVAGWDWLRKKQLPQTRPVVGYARALSGIVENLPGGSARLFGVLPAKVARRLQSGELYSLMTIPRARFEEGWNRMPFNYLKSRF
jgi:hypothetical protein